MKPFILEVNSNIDNAQINFARFDLVAKQVVDKLSDLLENYQEIEISVLIANDEFIKNLNKEYRGKDKATNVLSFANVNLLQDNITEAAFHLGDIIISEETIIREAVEQNKSIDAHYLHMFLHGLLHLIGYDHIENQDAEIMEMLEIEILSNLAIKNPYQ